MKGHFGVIGLGAMGRHHVRIYSELGLLGAVCDVSAAQVENFSKEYKVPGYTDVDEMLKDKHLIGISVVTPTPTHAEITKKCLQAGLHVLLEKPMAPTLEEAEELVRAAKRKNLILAVGYIESYNPAFKFIQETNAMGNFGEITSVNIKRVGGAPRSADNVITDLMTHDIGLLVRLLGKNPHTLSSLQHKEGIVDSAQILMGFGNVSATCEANWVSPVKIRHMHVTGTDAYCEADLITQRVRMLRRHKLSGDSVTAKYGPDFEEGIITLNCEPLREELEQFIKCTEMGPEELAHRGLDNIVTGDEGLEILKLTLEAAKKANNAF